MSDSFSFAITSIFPALMLYFNALSMRLKKSDSRVNTLHRHRPDFMWFVNEMFTAASLAFMLRLSITRSIISVTEDSDLL